MEAKEPMEIDGEAEIVDAQAVAVKTPFRLAMALALAALLAVAIGLFLGYRYWLGLKLSLEQINASLEQASRDQAAIEKRLSETSLVYQQQQQRIDSQRQELADQRMTLEQERESLHQQSVQLNRSLSSMQQRLGGKQPLWRVAEAEYLMRVANHRLSLMADPTTALAMLKSADERLLDTGDPGWNGVRQLLAQEIIALEAVPTVDRIGLSASLDALIKQMDQLRLREQGVELASMPAAKGTDKPTEEAEERFSLRRLFMDLWNGFKSMMVIRHHDRPMSALLPPEQRYFLIQNLRLKLEGAKVAVHESNAMLYRDNLNAATDWVERYFERFNPQVEGFRQSLLALAQQDIAPELPDISASLRALQSRRQEQNQRDAE